MKEQRTNNVITFRKFLPPDVQASLAKAMEDFREGKISEKNVPLCDCPQCGRETASDCLDIANINDPTIGFCMECGYLWCLECDMPLTRSVECAHWHICESCDSERDESGHCGKIPWECEYIGEWKCRPGEGGQQ